MKFSAIHTLPTDWCLVDTGIDQGRVVLTVEVMTSPAGCPNCSAGLARAYRHGYREIDYVDAPAWGRPVRVRLRLRRYRCRDCGTAFRQHAAAVHTAHRMTQRCVDYLMSRADGRSIRDLADELACCPMTVRQVLVEQHGALVASPPHSTGGVGSVMRPKNTPSSVSEVDVSMWLIANCRIHPQPGRARDYYVRGWSVHEKIQRAKANGEWDDIRTRALLVAANHQLLGYLVE